MNPKICTLQSGDMRLQARSLPQPTSLTCLGINQGCRIDGLLPNRGMKNLFSACCFLMIMLCSVSLLTGCTKDESPVPEPLSPIATPPPPALGEVGRATIGDTNTPLEHAYAVIKGQAGYSELNVFLTPAAMSEEDLKGLSLTGWPSGVEDYVRIEIKSNTDACPATNEVGVIQFSASGIGLPKKYNCGIGGASVLHNLKAISGDYETGKTVRCRMEHGSVRKPYTFRLDFEAEILADLRKTE